MDTLICRYGDEITIQLNGDSSYLKAIQKLGSKHLNGIFEHL